MSTLLFVDAETDGLYGRFLSIAAVLVEDGEIKKKFYQILDCCEADIKSEWVLKNVYPYLRANNDILIEHQKEEDLIEAFWNFYKSQGECFVVGDVISPVECRLFSRCVERDIETREFEGPFPLLDLSSMLYAKDINPKANRKDLCENKNLTQHNALDDVLMAVEIWNKYIK